MHNTHPLRKQEDNKKTTNRRKIGIGVGIGIESLIVWFRIVRTYVHRLADEEVEKKT